MSDHRPDDLRIRELTASAPHEGVDPEESLNKRIDVYLLLSPHPRAAGEVLPHRTGAQDRTDEAECRIGGCSTPGHIVMHMHRSDLEWRE